MTVIRASLLPILRITTEEGTFIDLGSPTQRALFAYLLINRSTPCDRRRLAFLFWPRGTEAAARRNLRQYLHRIRKTLEEAGLPSDILLTNGNTVQINPDIIVWLDIEAFLHETRPDAKINELQQAIDRYQGDLLEEVYEDWVHNQREELRKRYLHTLQRLANTAEANETIDQAVRYLQKYLEYEPFDETAHQHIMRLYTRANERNRAIQHYHSLSVMLQEELDTQPLPETKGLYETIQRGALPSVQHDSLHSITQSAQLQTKPHPLIGRDEQLNIMEQVYQETLIGNSRVILITGESGIGKTRLVNEYQVIHSDVPVLQSLCSELDARIPFAALRYAIERSIHLLPTLVHPPPWIPSLASLIPALGQHFQLSPNFILSQPNSLQFQEMVRELFTMIGKHHLPSPLHLILDNLHWADSQTWELLAYIAHRPPPIPLLIIGLCRLEDLLPEHHRLVRTLRRDRLLNHISLPRLTHQETKALAQHVLGKTSTDDIFYQRLYQETEGNPFFVIETLRAMQEGGYRLGDFAVFKGQSGVPIGVQQVIESRLERLTPESQELLAIAAVMGRAFTFSLLGRISQKSKEFLIDCLEEWVRRGLVREYEDGYDFTHDKIRYVAYTSLSRARRQYIHRRVAQVLENALPQLDVSTLAHHFSLSDEPDKALPYLIATGEQALRVRSYREAQQVGLEAVNLLGRMTGPEQRTERIDLNLQLAQAYAFSNDLKQAQEILGTTERLAASLKDEVRLGEVFRRSSQIFWLRGQPATAGDYARRALRIAEEQSSPALLYAALRMLGRVGIALSTFDDAIAYLMRYLTLVPESDAPPALSIVLGYLGVAYGRVGSWQRGFEAAESGTRIAEAEGAPQTIVFARMQQAFIYSEYHNWENALKVLELIPDPRTEDGNLTPLGFMVLGLKGRVLGYLGKPKEGIEAIQPALDWAVKTDYRIFHYLPRTFLAECHLLNRHFNLALSEATIALEQAQISGNRWAVGYILRLLGEIQTHMPNPNWLQIENLLIDSRDFLRQVRARPELARTYLSLRRLYDRAGQIAWAVDCHFRATTIFEELGMREELRLAQGQAAGNRRGAVVIPNLNLRGPNQSLD